MCDKHLSECVSCRDKWQCQQGQAAQARHLSRALASAALSRPPARFPTARRHPHLEHCLSHPNDVCRCEMVWESEVK